MPKYGEQPQRFRQKYCTMSEINRIAIDQTKETEREMRNILKAISAIAAAAGMAGCVSTNEMEVAPNVVMLQTDAGGLLYRGRSGPEMMKKAAEETISRGYTCFALSGAQMKTGSQYAGSIATIDGYGYGNSFNATGISTPIYRHVESAGATVTMSKECGPGLFRAADILKRSAQS